MSTLIIPYSEGEAHLDWLSLCAALEAGHARPRAEMSDTLLYRGADSLLNRAAWIDGLGMVVKSATIFPGNPAKGHAAVNGAVTLYDDESGTLSALIDFHLVTKWKTAGDSLYAAMRLARPDSNRILIVGAGTVGRSLFDAYRALFPEAQFTVWNRTMARAEEMARECDGMTVTADLEAAVTAADIVSSATLSRTPLIRGEWLRPGQHIDLIGSFRPDMREADDAALKRARLFVDNYDTTINHTGEIRIPLDSGVIARADLLADFYEPQNFRRRSEEEITLFKNGGGAHLDLMTCRFILDAWESAR